MARFDVYQLTQAGQKRYVLDVQSNHLSGLNSRVIVPLVDLPLATLAIKDLHPVFELGGANYIMLTEEISAILARHLKRPILSFSDRHADIMRALDILLIGY